MSEGYAAAVQMFAESTQRAITQISNALEVQEQNLEHVTSMLETIGEWAPDLQQSLVDLTRRVEELEKRID